MFDGLFVIVVVCVCLCVCCGWVCQSVRPSVHYNTLPIVNVYTSRADRTLQTLVYKLVPGLFQSKYRYFADDSVFWFVYISYHDRRFTDTAGVIRCHQSYLSYSDIIRPAALHPGLMLHAFPVS